MPHPPARHGPARHASAIIGTMKKVHQFIQAASGEQHGPKWKSKYRLPDTCRLDLEEKAGAAPLIQLGEKGFNLIYQFEDGVVLIVAPYASDEVIRGAIAFVARSQ